MKKVKSYEIFYSLLLPENDSVLPNSQYNVCECSLESHKMSLLLSSKLEFYCRSGHKRPPDVDNGDFFQLCL
jgi:hypothetical protein